MSLLRPSAANLPGGLGGGLGSSLGAATKEGGVAERSAAAKRTVQARYLKAKGFSGTDEDAMAADMNAWFAGAVPEARFIDVLVLSATRVLVLYTES